MSEQFAPIEPIEPHDPTMAAGNQQPPSPEEQRHFLEEAMGGAVTHLFEQHVEHAGRLRQGGEVLKLYSPTTTEGRRHPVLRVAQVTDNEGNRSAHLSYLGSGGHKHFRFTDGPDKEPRFEECDRDPETGKLTPKKKPEPTRWNPNPYDPTSDEAVVAWAMTWLHELKDATPVKPRSGLSKLGRGIMSAVSKMR